MILWWAVATLAAPTRYITCDVRLTLPTGEVTLTGHGASEAEARAHARRMATTTAEFVVHTESWALWPAVGAVKRTVAQLDTRTLDGPAPGVAIAPLDCKTRSLDGERGTSWTVTWHGGDPVVRSEPGLAIEAARRRTCFGRWQAGVRRWSAAYEAGGVEPITTLLAFQDARDELLNCVSRGVPDVRSAHGALAHVPGNLFVCGRPRFRGGWVRALGFGDDLEAAREAAAMRDLRIVARQSFADVAFGRSDALRPLEELVVGSDPAEQSLSLCRAGDPGKLHVGWHPTAAVEARCGAPPPPALIAATPIALEEMGESRCDSVQNASLQELLTVEVRADKAAEVVGTAAACAASCARDIALVDWEGQPVQRPGEVVRTSGAAAARALQRAVEDRDFESLAILTGGTLFAPRSASVARKQADTFWGSLESALASGRFEAISRWETIDGHLICTFR